MTISRRHILAAAAAAPFSAWANDAKEKPVECAPREGDLPSLQESLLKDMNHLPAMQRDVFWGYRTAGKVKQIPLGDQMLSTAYSLLLSIRDNQLFSVNTAVKRPYCDDPESDMLDYQSTPAGPVYDQTAAQIARQLSHVPALMNKVHGEQRFFQTVSNLRQSFRTVLYEAHTDWFGLPKTLVQLRHDGIGDCKDFALSRYMFARFMGVNPDHLAIVIYADGDPKSNDGHANLALYDPKWGWVMIDGIGRQEGQEKGNSFSLQNSQYFKDAMARDYMGRAVPVAYVSHRGFALFDSILSINPDGTKIFKKPQPIPQRTSHYLGAVEEAVYTPDPPLNYNGP